MASKHRIGIVTAGGDCPGMNTVVRAVAKTAMLDYGFDVIGIEDGFEGLVSSRWHPLAYEDVSGIVTLGGTILGTSNTVDPYSYARKIGAEIQHTDESKIVLRNIEALAIDGLVCVGGDGSLTVANRLSHQGVAVIGVPKTIDNDVEGTDVSVGFDTAMSIATEAIDRVHTSAQSHHRVMIVEVMGRNAGWLALFSGIAGGGDIVIIPEIPFEIGAIVDRVKERSQKGKRFTIVVVSEGARPVGGQVVIKRMVQNSADPIRLGGISFVLADQIEEITSIETRALVLGHLLRGGPPSAADRVLATRLGTKAMEFVVNHRFGHMVGVKANDLVEVPLEDVADKQRKVPVEHPLVKAARSVGTCFGDKL